ncbi:virulence factor SrfB [Cohaesibacter intestini]|uniref:virulence factor SrfB n=1 Tax=Cohaesibacter intestini TaxID=2211145 RepID=UPI000DEACF74|nr:virulence factor SrfB [Cohaesibacter intestini]
MTTLANISLVPFSGIQFVTRELDLSQLTAFKPYFIERIFEADRPGEDPYRRLLQGWNEEDPDGDPPHEEQGNDIGYGISKTAALEPFLGKWFPVPYLRRTEARTADGALNFALGPSNWARAMIVSDSEKSTEDGLWYKVIFAFDTALDLDEDDDDEAGEGRDEAASEASPYVAPRRSDVRKAQEFHFVSSMSKIAWFLSNPQTNAQDDTVRDYQIWVANWIEELFESFLEKKSKGKRRERERFLEHIARWITLIQIIDKLVVPEPVRFVDTVSDDKTIRPVEVDLVLDVGNSRTCGMLIENYPNEDAVELNNSLVLKLRDLQQPWITYDEPFESHVTLSQADFGPENLSRQSTRGDAFLWPTLVRVGPEAMRIKQKEPGSGSIIGMSAPKRYLWDVAAANQFWRFPHSDYGIDEGMPWIGRIARRRLNPNGDVLSHVQDDMRLYASLYPGTKKADFTRPSTKLSYSRSAFYGFMLSEIVYQAWVMINDPAVRAERRQSEAPRKLNRIILTLPTALPIQEQRIMKARAESAVQLLWDIFEWEGNQPPGVHKPSVHVSWDEASCVQFVWLYGEASRRFRGHIQEFFEMTGKPRPRFEADELPTPGTPSEPSLRVACLDIGGGTTDLMITTFFQKEDRAILPVQTFRECVRIAGDDITKAIIERCLMPVIERALIDHGAREARTRLSDLFNGDRANMSEQQKHARRQYVQQVLVPAALGIMERYEASGEDRYEAVHSATVAELVRESLSVSPSVLQYLQSAFAQGHEDAFDIMSMTVPVDFTQVAKAIDETMEPVFSTVAEALAHFDCDYVLLSGRPSKLAAVQENLLNRLFIAPDRLLSMGHYRAGNWYPFRSRGNTEIGDPKSCVVVGGVLCALAERSLTNFMLYTNMLQARSTTHYIGVLEQGGKLYDKNVLFAKEDDEPGGEERDHNFNLYSESLIGYRQLPYERWVTAPLYHVRITDANLARPIDVQLSRDEVEDLEEQDLPNEQAVSLMKHEATKEDLRIEEAMDPVGSPVDRSVMMTFRTFPLEQGDHWLDSGILQVGE